MEETLNIPDMDTLLEGQDTSSDGLSQSTINVSQNAVTEAATQAECLTACNELQTDTSALLPNLAPWADFDFDALPQAPPLYRSSNLLDGSSLESLYRSDSLSSNISAVSYPGVSQGNSLDKYIPFLATPKIAPSLQNHIVVPLRLSRRRANLRSSLTDLEGPEPEAVQPSASSLPSEPSTRRKRKRTKFESTIMRTCVNIKEKIDRVASKISKLRRKKKHLESLWQLERSRLDSSDNDLDLETSYTDSAAIKFDIDLSSDSELSLDSDVDNILPDIPSM